MSKPDIKKFLVPLSPEESEAMDRRRAERLDISSHPRVRKVSFEDIATELTPEEIAAFETDQKQEINFLAGTQPVVSTNAQEPDTGEDDSNPFSDRTWQTFAETIGQLESSGRYDITGGANDHYDGAYQMGRMAKMDAGARLGIDLGHDAASREAFRGDPDLQDRAFQAFTESNHDTLMRISGKYRALPPARKLEVLAVSHLLGSGGGKAWLNGQEGADAFGTKGTKYAEAIREALKG